MYFDFCCKDQVRSCSDDAFSVVRGQARAGLFWEPLLTCTGAGRRRFWWREHLNDLPACSFLVIEWDSLWGRQTESSKPPVMPLLPAISLKMICSSIFSGPSTEEAEEHWREGSGNQTRLSSVSIVLQARTKQPQCGSLSVSCKLDAMLKAVCAVVGWVLLAGTLL